MYSFTFGTYNGLFVECDVPAVLPNDTSYFDFRRKKGRAIPDDSSPNVVIRKFYSENDDTAGDLLLVALIYKAQEGVREGGFIGFGSILVNNHTQSNIKIALQNAINLANKSGDFFSDGKIFGKPKISSSDRIDLRDLPIKGSAEFFVIAQDSLSNPRASETISKMAEDLYENYDSFEIVINENTGLQPSEIIPYLTQQYEIQVKNRRMKIRAEQKYVNEEKLKNFGGRKSQSSNTPVIIAIALASFSVICALALVAFLIFRSDPAELPIEPSKTPSEEALAPENTTDDDQLPTDENENEIVGSGAEPKIFNKQGCNITDDQLTQPEEQFLSSNLKHLNSNFEKNIECIELGNTAKEFFYTSGEDSSYITYVSQDYENISDYFSEELKELEYHLVSFQSFLDSFEENSSQNNWLIDEDSNNKYGIGITSPTSSEQFLYCTPDILDATKDQKFELNLYYFTHSSGNFRQIADVMALKFLHQFQEAWGQIDQEYLDDAQGVPDYDDLRIDEMKKFIERLLELTEINAVDFDDMVVEPKNSCFLTFSREDHFILNSKVNVKEIEILDYFINAYNLQEIRDALDFDIGFPSKRPKCIDLPEYVLIWNHQSPSSYKGILSNFNFRSENNSNEESSILDFKFKLSSDVDVYIDLPQVNGLKDVYNKLYKSFELKDLHPFSLETIPQEQICSQG